MYIQNFTNFTNSKRKIDSQTDAETLQQPPSIYIYIYSLSFNFGYSNETRANVVRNRITSPDKMVKIKHLKKKKKEKSVRRKKTLKLLNKINKKKKGGQKSEEEREREERKMDVIEEDHAMEGVTKRVASNLRICKISAKGLVLVSTGRSGASLSLLDKPAAKRRRWLNRSHPPEGVTYHPHWTNRTCEKEREREREAQSCADNQKFLSFKFLFSF